MIRKNLMMVLLASLCLITGLIMIKPTASKPGAGGYSPYADINGDGVIDILDAIVLAGQFGTQGTPLPKASVLYDSGLINITDKGGQDFIITHDLNRTDLTLDITTKATMDGPEQKCYGLKATGGWEHTYGDFVDQEIHSIVKTKDGGYAMGGRSLSFGTGYDFYIVKTNSTGDAEWAHNFGGPYDDTLWTPSTIVETDDGGLMFAGTTKSFGAGNGDLWLIKTDMLGNALWNRTYGGANDDGGAALIKTTDGGYLIAGGTTSWGAGGQDAWLVKIDADGNEQWNRTYGGTGHDVAMSVVQTTDGGYAVGVLTKSFGLGGWNAWLIKTDENGTKQWDRVYGGAGDYELYSIIQVSGDTFVLGGDTNSIGAGGLDGWLLQTDLEYGLVWKDTTPNSFIFFRPMNEAQSNFVRVRLLEIEP